MSNVTHSAELKQVLNQARDIARQTDQTLSSAHVLLASFTVPNLAELLLHERGVNEETLLSHIESIEREPPNTLDRLERLTLEVAERSGSKRMSCLHLLAAMTRLPEAFACRLLARASVDVDGLRRTALRYATEGIPERLVRTERALEAPREHTETLEYAAVPLTRDTESDLPPVRETVSVAAHSTIQVPRIRDQAGEAAAERREARGRRSTDHGSDDSDRRREHRRRHTAPPSTPYSLDAERYPWLDQLGRNLSAHAYAGGLDPVIGREAEIEQAIDVLNKRRSNNPCLLGEPGVGKTAVAEGVAARLVAEQSDRLIVQIDVGAILAGTHLRGSLAERLRGLRDEVLDAAGRVVVFIDEIHTLVGAGGADGGHDAANELKAALARGEFPCIGATTPDEYRTHVESDPALERRFTSVHVPEPDAQATRAILEGMAARYAEHHGVRYQPEGLDAAARLSRRYIHDRHDPDRALGVLDLAGAVARRAGTDVDRRAVAEVVARLARVPTDHLLTDRPQRFLKMEAALGERIVGQRHVLSAVSETIRRNFAGFAGRRPIGSFLFLGPTGVGKTEVVKATAEFLFGKAQAMTRFDMSEYLEQHSVSRLVGAPPGYVGHDEGGQLTEAVRKRPYQVILFDEIEKGHRDVWNLLLQVLDDGRVTDGRGRTVDCSNTVIVMTSNLGAEAFSAQTRRIGFAGEDAAGAQAERALEEARAAFPPELWNRIECRLAFHPLDRGQVRKVARVLLRQRSRLLAEERGISFEATDAAIEHLIDNGGFEPTLGARPMRQTIARLVESPLAERILAGDIARGAHVRVNADSTGLRFAL